MEARVNDLLERMTTDEKIDLISGDTPFRTHAIARLNIPYFQMADGPVGAHIPAPTVAYAAGIGLAATWDPELAERLGRELGRYARSRGAVFLLGPGVNIYRAPMNGRNFEYFGEDPFLAGRIELDPRSFAYFDAKAGAWQADAGSYTLSLGNSVNEILAKTLVQLSRRFT